MSTVQLDDTDIVAGRFKLAHVNNVIGAGPAAAIRSIKSYANSMCQARGPLSPPIPKVWPLFWFLERTNVWDLCDALDWKS